DAEAALEIAQAEVPDVVLTDLMMPGMDGFEFVRLLRATPSTRGVPIVMLSARASGEALLEGLEAGADDYLVKPFTPAELLARLRTHIRMARLRNQLNEDLKRVNEELILWRSAAEGELDKQRQELERAFRDAQQFTYVASHDLQEPLRAISGCLQLLQKRYSAHLPDATASQLMEHAVAGADRMRALVRDLLTLSRLDSRAEEAEEVDCAAVVRDALANLKEAVAETGASVEVGDLPRLTGARTQLVQLFQNLLGNALKFRGDRPPRVRVSAHREGGSWHFQVEDNGIGIAPEHSQRIFLIFQRLHGASEYPGTGIGLAICRKVVERHGGSIRVESEPGRGSTFHVVLPA
ncbi:MAG: ATP-binding protein, partial [Candidatus Eremiobacterota bacterium]